MGLRHLGFACINKTLREQDIFTNRTLRKKNFTLDKVSDLALQNSRDLLTIIKWNTEHNIKFFRISSDMFPFWDHPDFKYSVLDLKNKDKILEYLVLSGILCLENDIKLETHPGPFNCLASPNESVVEKTILCLEKHTEMIRNIDSLSHIAINIHVGGVYNDHEKTAERFCKNFDRLSDECKERLVIENDDKKNGWNVRLLNDLIYPKIGTPITFDYHHHQFCDGGLDWKDAANICRETWETRDLVPTIHYSESRDPNKQIPAHSGFIYKKIPDFYENNYDIMIEAKEKELALLKYRKDHEIKFKR